MRKLALKSGHGESISKRLTRVLHARHLLRVDEHVVDTVDLCRTIVMLGAFLLVNCGITERGTIQNGTWRARRGRQTDGSRGIREGHVCVRTSPSRISRDVWLMGELNLSACSSKSLPRTS